MDVLTKAQEESAFWRPTKPFLAQDNGMSLFPISVEVANSILRSCELYDGKELYNTFGSRNIGLFRRYWQWLRARAVRLKEADSATVVGWHSEHVNETDAIHVWETSQVLEFLLLYRKLLLDHIARTTLVLSRFTVRQPKSAKGWDDIAKDYEPVTVLGEQFQFYERIGVDFIKGWKQRMPKHFSMLLYGPPGTGKTTVAENVADTLGFPMITITVSDFLAGGGAQLESRAKAIFEVLSSQTNCVVLFDEIDNFLLDRDAPRYAKQDTSFQFMTPGMLTKLNNLRREKRLLFIIATNYAYRIDAAIKRTGRIDKQYLALPPDASARQRMIERFLLDEDLDLSRMGDWETVRKASLNLGYTDIRGAVKDAAQGKAVWMSRLPGILTTWARTTNLSTYYSKFADKEDRDKPVEEFVALLGLELEVCGDEIDSDSVRAIGQASSQFGKDPITRDAVKKKVPDISDQMADKISQTLERYRVKRPVRSSGVQTGR
jgi:SpoVK/Ycf46/Vps4 family AAA+-type ATPase